MDGEQTLDGPEVREQDAPADTDRRLNSAAGGLILIWIGLTVLVSGGWGMALLGIGLVLVGEQIVRQRQGVEFDRWWVFVGLGVLAGGLVLLLGLWDVVVPLLLIVVGALLLASAVRGK